MKFLNPVRSTLDHSIFCTLPQRVILRCYYICFLILCVLIIHSYIFLSCAVEWFFFFCKLRKVHKVEISNLVYRPKCIPFVTKKKCATFYPIGQLQVMQLGAWKFNIVFLNERNELLSFLTYNSVGTNLTQLQFPASLMALIHKPNKMKLSCTKTKLLLQGNKN